LAPKIPKLWPALALGQLGRIKLRRKHADYRVDMDEISAGSFGVFL
jgi:hypothetical protein